ncbi:MAG: aa3-type cytochrome c oxidase subunit IV [Aestuariivirga sp.]|uniref:aa3-type cytochrome c oxidase subunit IV n=1 Tax=Aestuariivirga sp. TaxID=2650926 RepID=UPI00301658E5
MAEHGTHTSNAMDYEQAHSTYAGFLKGSVVLTIFCLYVLVALCAFAFIDKGNVLIGFAGLIIGAIALIVDLRASHNWYISVGWLVIFGLFTAVSVS